MSRYKAAHAGRGTQRRWVKAYSRYAATSARVSQRRRWAFFSSLPKAVDSRSFPREG
jgi:hypothetical protein